MSAPATFADAVLEHLRSGLVALATGDTFNVDTQTGVIGIGFDYLPPQTTTPYIVVQQPGESLTWFTRGQDGTRPFLADGSITFECYAASRDQAGSLGRYVSESLHDQPLTWGTSAMRHLRETASSFIPTPDVGLSTPTLFLRVLTFEFEYQGSL